MIKYVHKKSSGIKKSLLKNSKPFLNLYDKYVIMDIKVLVHVNADEAKEATERLVKENLENKLDNYLKKFTSKEDATGTIEVKIEKNKKNLFNGVVQASLDGQSFRYSREDYKKLDDLVNHLFDHFKEELSNI